MSSSDPRSAPAIVADDGDGGGAGSSRARRTPAAAEASGGLAPPDLPYNASGTNLSTAGDPMECSIYQNYSAAEVFVQGLAGMVNQQDVESMIRAQKKMLQRFEKTNEMLSNCNTLSATRFERAARDFKAHTTHVLEMKRDLEIILKRIRIIKQKIAAQNPQAFQGTAV